MSKVLTGHYRQAFSGQPPAAHLSGTVLFGDTYRDVDFLIDTGSDVTVLSPQDATELFGEAVYRRLGTLFPDNRISLTGVGVGEAMELPLTLVFRVPDERPLVFREHVLVTPPLPEQQALDNTIGLPSLLGRDIINHFSLLLNPASETVELTELDQTPPR